MGDSSKRKVVISGVTGMDGSHMVDYLLANTDVDIIGLVRRLSVKNWKHIEHNLSNSRFVVEEFDITDPISVEGVIRKHTPDYFINFAANSFVGNSWSQPELHMRGNSLGVLYCLEAIRKFSPNTRFYQASSSEMFGDVKYQPQDENHPFTPRSVYGVSKVTSHLLVKVFRESYGIYAVGGILFNHESSSGRRGEEFVTRKITKAVAGIYKAILEDKPIEVLRIGNILAKRDWSAAEDFCDGVWKMLNQDEDIFGVLIPKDYVLASGETHSVREFIELAFAEVGIEGSWSGSNPDDYFWYEFGPKALPSSERKLVVIDPKFYRPADVELLIGDARKAIHELGWKPTISFPELVKRMVKADLKEIGYV